MTITRIAKLLTLPGADKATLRLLEDGTVALPDIDTQSSSALLVRVLSYHEDLRAHAKITLMETRTPGRSQKAYALDAEGTRLLQEYLPISRDPHIRAYREKLQTWLGEVLIPAQLAQAASLPAEREGMMRLRLPDGCEHTFRLLAGSSLSFTVNGVSKALSASDLFHHLGL